MFLRGEIGRCQKKDAFRGHSPGLVQRQRVAARAVLFGGAVGVIECEYGKGNHKTNVDGHLTMCDPFLLSLLSFFPLPYPILNLL